MFKRTYLFDLNCEFFFEKLIHDKICYGLSHKAFINMFWPFRIKTTQERNYN